MLRSWLIRGFFIFLCVVCAGAWAMSYFRTTWIGYFGRGVGINVNLEWGSICGKAHRDPSVVDDSWTYYHRQADEGFVRDMYAGMDHQFLGFAYHWKRMPDDHAVIVVPSWFPAAVAGFLVWYAWRKTRKQVPSKAFPVEPGAQR